MITPEKIADCQSSLLEFVKYNFKQRKGIDFIENWHHVVICDALEKVLIGKTKRLIINIPPRYSKTEIAVVNFIAWSLGIFPDSEFIHSSYSGRLAVNNSWNAREIVNSESFSEIFGDNVTLRYDSNAKGEWRTEQGGCVYATGAGGSITGYGAGKMRDTFGGAIIIDDPHKASEATSDTMRQNIIDWFTTTIESRCNNPEKTPIIVIMQRLHENDLAGWLLDGGNGEEWEHLNIPAISEDGEPLWEQKHTLEQLRNIEKMNSYVFAGQYMQRPAPLGGGLFKDKYWQFYDELPRVGLKIITADTASKEGELNDYSVFQLWGMSWDYKAYLIDQIRGKWEQPELITQCVAFWNKCNSDGYVSKLMIEDKSSGTALLQILERKTSIPLEAIQRGNREGKIARALNAIPYIENGNVYLPRNAYFLSDYLREFSQFPKGNNDDQIDPTVDAIVEIMNNVSTINYGALV